MLLSQPCIRINIPADVRDLAGGSYKCVRACVRACVCVCDAESGGRRLEMAPPSALLTVH